VIYVPVLQEAFHAVPLTLGDWLVAAAVGATLLVIMELVKWVLRAGGRGHPRLVTTPGILSVLERERIH
jgi:hypothetical protein